MVRGNRLGSARPFLIELEQAREDFVVGERARAPVVAPAVGFGHRFIQRLVGVVEPCGTGVVEVGQGARLEDLGGGLVLRQQAVWVAGDHLGNPVHEVGGVQPVFALGVQVGGGGGDLLRARVGGIVGGGNVGRQPLGEGEGLEGGRGGVAGVVADAEEGAHAQRPEFVEARMQDAEGGVVVAGDGDNG